MSENTKDEKDLEKAIEAQLKGQLTAVPTEGADEKKAETLETRTNKSAM